jgi:26S proteasome regulatory subunit N8
VWFLDHNYVEAMNDMFKKVNGKMTHMSKMKGINGLMHCLFGIAKEKMIGWYHSGPKLRSSDLEINELFKRYTPNPVLVIVDVKPKDVEIPTDAYFSIEEIKDVSSDRTSTTFLLICTHSFPLFSSTTGWYSYDKDFYACAL